MKLKKRANPLEKIVTKLMQYDQVRDLTSAVAYKTEPAIISIKEEAKKEIEDVQLKLPKQTRYNLSISVSQL